MEVTIKWRGYFLWNKKTLEKPKTFQKFYWMDSHKKNGKGTSTGTLTFQNIYFYIQKLH